MMKNKQPDDVGRLLTMAQARDALNCGRDKLYQLRDRGLLEFVKLDHRTRVTERSIKQYVRKLVETSQLAIPKNDAG
jgi:hypothetical protein